MQFEFKQCSIKQWHFYKKYHYLSENIPLNSECYELKINDKKIGFLAINKFIHPKVKNIKMINRIVVIPEFQGFGLAIKMMNIIAEIQNNNNYKTRIVTSLKPFIISLNKTKEWKLKRMNRVSSGSGSSSIHNKKNIKSFSYNRITASFEYKNNSL